MKLGSLREEHLEIIVAFYEQKCGFKREFRESLHQSPEEVLEHLKKYGSEEYRIGSRWSTHSKLFIEATHDGQVVVRFNSNLAPEEREGSSYKAAERAGKEFIRVATDYLQKIQT